MVVEHLLHAGDVSIDVFEDDALVTGDVVQGLQDAHAAPPCINVRQYCSTQVTRLFAINLSTARFGHVLMMGSLRRSCVTT